MKDIHLIDSCQAHLPVQYTLRTSISFARSDTGVVIDSEPHLSRMWKTCLLFAPLPTRVHTGCSTFPFYTPSIKLNI